MAAIVRREGISATFGGGRWRSVDPLFEDQLARTVPDQTGHDPNYPGTAARAAAAALRGVEIVHVDETSDPPAGAVP